MNAMCAAPEIDLAAALKWAPLDAPREPNRHLRRRRYCMTVQNSQEPITPTPEVLEKFLEWRDARIARGHLVVVGGDFKHLDAATFVQGVLDAAAAAHESITAEVVENGISIDGYDDTPCLDGRTRKLREWVGTIRVHHDHMTGPLSADDLEDWLDVEAPQNFVDWPPTEGT